MKIPKSFQPLNSVKSKEQVFNYLASANIK